MSKSGFTLLEILIGIGLLSILSSIAVVQYQGYILDVEKKELYNSSVRFASRVNACITSVGEWGVTKPDGTKATPCKAETTAALKSKLNYTCPADSTCEFYSRDHTTTTDNNLRYHCLSIKNEDKKLQVIILIPYDNPSDYEIWCGEISESFFAIEGTNCQKAHGFDQEEGFKSFGECWKQDP